MCAGEDWPFQGPGGPPRPSAGSPSWTLKMLSASLAQSQRPRLLPGPAHSFCILSNSGAYFFTQPRPFPRPHFSRGQALSNGRPYFPACIAPPLASPRPSSPCLRASRTSFQSPAPLPAYAVTVSPCPIAVLDYFLSHRSPLSPPTPTAAPPCPIAARPRLQFGPAHSLAPPRPRASALPPDFRLLAPRPLRRPGVDPSAHARLLASASAGR